MKLKSLFFPSLLALGVAAAARGQEIKFPGTTPPPASRTMRRFMRFVS